MNIKILSAVIVILISFNAFAQPSLYKNDNVAYKTITAKEFCEILQANPKLTVIDVRSPG